MAALFECPLEEAWGQIFYARRKLTSLKFWSRSASIPHHRAKFFDIRATTWYADGCWKRSSGPGGAGTPRGPAPGTEVLMQHRSLARSAQEEDRSPRTETRACGGCFGEGVIVRHAFYDFATGALFEEVTDCSCCASEGVLRVYLYAAPRRRS